MSALRDLRHPKAGTPDQQHVYSDKSGAPVLVANRYERIGKSKFFLPYDVTAQTWKAPQSRPIYNLHAVLQAPPEQPVLWVEGEKCADALIALGYLASTSFGGSKALGKTDLSPLAGRTVVIWPDYDEPGREYAAQLADVLLSKYIAKPLILPISEALIKEHDPRGLQPNYLLKGWDVADAITAGWNRGEIDTLVNQVVCDLPDSTPTPVGIPTVGAANVNSAPIPHGRETHEAATVDPAVEATVEPAATVDGLELWKTPQGEPYVTIPTKGRFEHWPTGSTTFRQSQH